VSGELDAASAGELRGPLMAALISSVVVLDLTPCSFCDSSGLGLIVEAWQRASVASCAFRVAGVDCADTVARTFELAGAEDFLDLFPDVESALRD
jgi:anti-sigma B factor antagonist